MIAYYKMRFFELDQSLKVGRTAEYIFFLDPHFDRAASLDVCKSMNLVFYNTLGGHPEVKALCEIRNIWHPALGQVDEIDTNGLDYRVTLADGAVIELNAEEEPGKCIDPKLQVQDWSFLVMLELKTAQQDTPADAEMRPG